MRKVLLLLITSFLLLATPSLVKAQVVATGNDSINEYCNGDYDGYASVEVTGGVMPYTYLWIPGGQVTQIDGNLSAGTYTVTVTDNLGATATAAVTITQPAALNVTYTVTSSTCGNSNGAIATTPSGGTGAYTYSWSNGKTTTTITGLSAGSYILSITDGNGCNIGGNVTVSNTSAIVISMNPVVDVSCNGGSNGSAKANGTGGALPYTYSWSTAPVQTNQTATGLSAGTYTVTVTDNGGCFTQDIVTITQPPPLTANISSSTNPVCNGISTGTATVVAGGGTTPYNYSWSSAPPQTNATATGLSAGTYTVTVKDKHGCSITASVTITQPPPVSGTFVTTGVLCNGGNTGTATVTGTGGTPPYLTYVWSTSPAQTNTMATGLSAGNYTVTITDNNGCTGTASVAITQPPPLTVTINPTQPPCNGDLGSAMANPAGGTTAYTYSWNTIPGQTNQTATGLTIGSYTVTVTDKNNCTATASVTITQPTPLITSTINTNVACNGGATATAGANPSGGTAPYTYSWSTAPVQTNQTATGLSAGTYTVTVKDNHGCTVTASITVTQPPPLTITTTNTYPLCNGDVGTSVANPVGGVSPYTYSWNTIPAQSNQTATGLTVGSYTVTVTDNNGCTATAVATITQPVVLAATIAPTDPLCNGQLGSATANPTGGTTPYTYSWSDGSSQTNQTATGLTIGSYTVTVTDNHGCLATASVTITQPTALATTMSATFPLCSAGLGTATSNPSGGTSPYTYSWTTTPVQTTQTATGLSAGTYTVTVKDNNGCTITASVLVTQPAALSSSIIPAYPLCNGDLGSAMANPSGGTSPYTYSWTTAPVQTNQTATGLTIGAYTVTVEDNSGCTLTASVTITQPPVLTVSIVPADPLCNGQLGSATANPGGGTLPYTYSWSNAQSNQTATGLTVGSYTVTVTDNRACTATASITITQPTALTLTINPITYPACNGGVGTATASPGGGTSPYTYSWTTGPIQTTQTATGLTAGIYTVTVTDKGGCTITASVLITQPTALTASIFPTYPLCNGGLGLATANPGGGNSPYTYTWTTGPVQTNQTATGLTAGSYTVIVKDNNGCTISASVAITQPIPITITFTTTYPSCGGGVGTSKANPTGGSLPYTYSWNPTGQVTQTATGLSAGSYTVTVTDNNGCSSSASVSVTQPTPITGILSSTTTTCGGSNGTATVSPSGGTSPYTYAWNPSGQSTATATGLSAGLYTVMVTDNHGCQYTASVAVNNSSSFSIVSTSSTSLLCNGANDGSAGITLSGGVTPYTYLWHPGSQTTATISGLSAGTYTVDVEDNAGCTEFATITITQPASALSLSTTTAASGCSNNTGTATINASGGTLGYAYLWSNAQTTSTISGLGSGSFTVTVTDANGCSASTTCIVPTIGGVTGTLSITNISCAGNSNGSATVSITSGVAPYTYSWSPIVNNTATINGVSAGSYTVTVHDNNGCLFTAVATITQPASALLLSTSATYPGCNGGTGTATANVSGGSLPYIYSWTSSPLQTTQTATGLSAGSYTVSVTDNSGCMVTASVSITQPPAITAFTSSTPENCANLDATASVIAGGGVAPLTYLWTPSGQTNTTATGLAAGTYTLTVTDNSGCQLTTAVVVNNTSTLRITTAQTNVLCYGSNDGAAIVNAFAGVTPYTYSWSVAGQTNANITGLSAGSYTITVTDNMGCTQFAVVTIAQPLTPITLSTSSTPSGCSNNTGTATVSSSGGSPTYAYSWSSGQTTSTITGIGSGIFTVTVTDANGCTATATSTVGTNGGVTGFFAITNVPCFGNNIGSITTFITAGVAPYTYSWAPIANTTASLTGLSAGSYTLVVNDANGCLFTAVATVAGPVSALSAITSSTNSSCNSTNDGSITLNVSGGLPQYTYLWSPTSSTTENLTNIVSGTYTVNIRDSNGCSLTTAVIVAANKTVLASPNKDTVLCKGTIVVLNGISSVNATTYQWYQMPGMTAIGAGLPIVLVNPPIGSNAYELIVTNGACSDTTHDTVFVAPASASAGPYQEIFGSGSVSIGGSPTGIAGSSYSWSPGSPSLNDSLLSNPTASPSVTTVYTVTVTNTYGCAATDTVTVFVYNGVKVPSGFSPNGDGVNDTWVLPFSGDFPTIIVEVYNRWGELLYHSDGYSIPWNGLYDNKPLPIGTYYYIIQLNDPRFPKALTGPVTILK